VETDRASSPRPPESDRHRENNSLRDVILGGQDGLVNILGIILGVLAGGGSKAVLLAAGFAAAVTESISMGAVGWTSSASDRVYYEAERQRAQAEIDANPDAQRRRTRDLFASRGFSGQLLDEVVDVITADRDRWLSTTMDEELHIQPVASSDIARSSAVITLATLVGHLIPLLPFVFVSTTPALILAVSLSALVLFGVGVYSAVTRVGVWWRSGLKMLAIGLGAAGIGFLIGRLFHGA
jgi:predicted membrane protein (TIGR00267 family)